MLGSPVVCCMCEAVVADVDVVAAAAAAVAAAVAGPLASLQFEAKELVRVCLLSTCADALHVMSDDDVERVRN